ncbi:MAG: hypothetical protein KME16_27450 [Scytolyngbya sp. HA4215-MV1]|nr:hypothetical protein [Scytolyngbya sp. HA4215-MV1]
MYHIFTQANPMYFFYDIKLSDDPAQWMGDLMVDHLFEVSEGIFLIDPNTCENCLFQVLLTAYYEDPESVPNSKAIGELWVKRVIALDVTPT